MCTSYMYVCICTKYLRKTDPLIVFDFKNYLLLSKRVMGKEVCMYVRIMYECKYVCMLCIIIIVHPPTETEYNRCNAAGNRG